MPSLAPELLSYIEEIESESAECARVLPDGEKCAQCPERLRVAGRLRKLLECHSYLLRHGHLEPAPPHPSR
jgi:hypothetical protein